jgi:shikimate dehydrogenase
MNLEKIIDGNTKIIGLIGNPVEHTISPLLHNTLSKKFRKNIIYLPFHVENDLKKAIDGLVAINALGFNITVPYKTDILQYLSSISDEAKLIGAVNTVINQNGSLHGENTDASGFYKSFCDESNMTAKGNVFGIIGAGGAARAIAVKLALEGAKKIIIFNRTISKANIIANDIVKNIGTDVVSAELSSDKLKKYIGDCQVLINTTSIGMFPLSHKSPIDSKEFLDNQVLYDVIYNPNITKFMEFGIEKGCKVINGFGMLMYQGIRAYELWSNIKVDKDIANEVINEIKKHINS